MPADPAPPSIWHAATPGSHALQSPQTDPRHQPNPGEQGHFSPLTEHLGQQGCAAERNGQRVTIKKIGYDGRVRETQQIGVFQQPANEFTGFLRTIHWQPLGSQRQAGLISKPPAMCRDHAQGLPSLQWIGIPFMSWGKEMALDDSPPVEQISYKHTEGSSSRIRGFPEVDAGRLRESSAPGQEHRQCETLDSRLGKKLRIKGEAIRIPFKWNLFQHLPPINAKS